MPQHEGSGVLCQSIDGAVEGVVFQLQYLKNGESGTMDEPALAGRMTLMRDNFRLVTPFHSWSFRYTILPDENSMV